MSVSTSNDRHPATSERPTSSPHPTVSRRRLGTEAALATHSDVEEVAFWARLEEREEGRIALEADHLFDTSYAWAV
jgi:hypothetical protein